MSEERKWKSLRGECMYMHIIIILWVNKINEEWDEVVEGGEAFGGGGL